MYQYKPSVYQSIQQGKEVKNIRKDLKKGPTKNNWQFYNNKHFGSQSLTYPARGQRIKKREDTRARLFYRVHKNSTVPVTLINLESLRFTRFPIP